MSRRPLHQQFLTSGLYLRNWSPATVRTYAQGLSTLPSEIPTKQSLEQWVISLRDRGVTPVGVNMYARTVNSYLSWLHTEGHVDARLKVKLLRTTKHQPTLLTPDDMRMIVRFVPQSKCERRTLTLIQLLLDTGCRINEVLTLRAEKVDLDGMSVVVMGKGAKERTVPISREMRKVLFRHLSKVDAPFVFATRNGGRLTYRNCYRDISRLCKRMNVGVKVHPHLFRHQFATTYICRGGDIYRLSRILGHTTISTTQLYLRGMGVEHLRDRHDTLSPLTMEGKA